MPDAAVAELLLLGARLRRLREEQGLTQVALARALGLSTSYVNQLENDQRPLTVPVLIFGVAAANAAIIGPTLFGPPFTILCGLSLMSLVIGPVAAAAALRHGLE